MKFQIQPRWELSDPAKLPTVPFIVISVTDPANEEVDIAGSPHCLGILRIAFDDVTGNYVDDVGEYFESQLVAMNDGHAKWIWAFVRLHPEAECIVCQCEAGISRSAGIAAGISVVLGLDEEWIFKSPSHVPNRYVRGLVIRNSGVAATDVPPANDDTPNWLK